MPHCILTEPSLSPHDRKGREGNREGKGWETFQDQSSQLKLWARAPRDWSW